MQCYIVGGAVRDALLGLPVSDRDWVVVGSTPQAMLDAGFKPVGKDFPVFLHPHTHEEYALARTERKSAPGYHGFSFYAAPDVTLEQDLARRDFTINAIAQASDGSLIDPYHGHADIAKKILRHVSPAFAEDPVRILRAARFLARFTEFEAAPETLILMQQMVLQGEVDALVPERVWQEISRGLLYAQPERMFNLLQLCGALARVCADKTCATLLLQNAVGLQAARQQNLSLAQTFAIALHGATAQQAQHLCAQWRVPNECADMARLWQTHGAALRAPKPAETESTLNVIEACDGLRKPERFQALLQLLAVCDAGLVVAGQGAANSVPFWLAALKAVRAVDAGAIAHATAVSAEIPMCVRAARLASLRQ